MRLDITVGLTTQRPSYSCSIEQDTSSEPYLLLYSAIVAHGSTTLRLIFLTPTCSLRSLSLVSSRVVKSASSVFTASTFRSIVRGRQNGRVRERRGGELLLDGKMRHAHCWSGQNQHEDEIHFTPRYWRPVQATGGAYSMLYVDTPGPRSRVHCSPAPVAAVFASPPHQRQPGACPYAERAVVRERCPTDIVALR